jgi:hypothetical protein
MTEGMVWRVPLRAILARRRYHDNLISTFYAQIVKAGQASGPEQLSYADWSTHDGHGQGDGNNRRLTVESAGWNANQCGIKNLMFVWTFCLLLGILLQGTSFVVVSYWSMSLKEQLTAMTAITWKKMALVTETRAVHKG